MFDISFSEFIIVIVVFVLFVNPKNIPKISHYLGTILKKLTIYFLMLKKKFFVRRHLRS